MSIPLVDLQAQYNSIRDELDAAIRRVVQGGQFILGSEVKAFEQEMAAYCGTKYAVGVASGTDALQLALLACGTKPGDEVITTPFTFIATAETIAKCGATPVFADIDPKTYNIDPAEVELKITPRTKAVLPVHLYGQPADMTPILALARKHRLKVIEDCAQSLGAGYASPRPPVTSHQSPTTSHRMTVSLGDAGCLSFFPSKVLGAYGDGGMVVTNSPEIAEQVQMLRNHGCREKYYHLMHGFNSRLDSLQAAILRVKLAHLDSWIEQRRRKASLYSGLFSEVAGIEPPYLAPYARHIFNYYTIRIRNSTGPQSRRNTLQQYLASQGIATAIYYPLSLHLQEVYGYLGHKRGDFPESERAQEEVLSLPIYPELSEGQVEKIAAAVGEWGVVNSE